MKSAPRRYLLRDFGDRQSAKKKHVRTLSATLTAVNEFEKPTSSSWDDRGGGEPARCEEQHAAAVRQSAGRQQQPRQQKMPW
jgi:hypothetical protein